MIAHRLAVSEQKRMKLNWTLGGICIGLMILCVRLLWRLQQTEDDLARTRSQLTVQRAQSSRANGATMAAISGADPHLPLYEVYAGYDAPSSKQN